MTVTTGARWTIVLGVVGLLGEDVVFLEGDVLDLVAELAREELRGVEVDRGVDVDAGHAHAPELLQHLGRLDAHAAREVGDGDRVLDADDALVLGGRGDRGLLALLAEGQLLATEVAAQPGPTARATGPTTALLLLREAATDRVRRRCARAADDRRPACAR